MTDAVSLLVSCTEYYAYLKNIAGNHVYVSLKWSGKHIVTNPSTFSQYGLRFLHGVIRWFVGNGK